MSAHIVVDVRLARDSGIGTYIRNTVPRVAALQPDWRFTLLGDEDQLRDESWARFPGVRLAHCGARIYGPREQLEILIRVPSNADVFWSPHFNIPLLLNTALVVTVHDVALLRTPQNFVRRLYARTELGAVRRKARSVMFDSEFSLREFRELVGEPKRVAVVPCGVDPDWFAPRTGEAPAPAPYFVFVGNFKPHKNARVLLEAMALNSGRLDANLVMIVRLSGLRQRDNSVWPLIEKLGDRVRVVDSVNDADLRRYVQHASALIMPSLYEGFGLPPLEAMAAGTPALVAKSGSLPEVCGDAALYFDPLDAAELAGAMRRIAAETELRKQLQERGAAQARRHTWDITASLARRELAHALSTNAA
jgi:glycosyltransferase involved in cell wall biosynthesis